MSKTQSKTIYDLVTQDQLNGVLSNRKPQKPYIFVFDLRDKETLEVLEDIVSNASAIDQTVFKQQKRKAFKCTQTGNPSMILSFDRESTEQIMDYLGSKYLIDNLDLSIVYPVFVLSNSRVVRYLLAERNNNSGEIDPTLGTCGMYKFMQN